MARKDVTAPSIADIGAWVNNTLFIAHNPSVTTIAVSLFDASYTPLDNIVNSLTPEFTDEQIVSNFDRLLHHFTNEVYHTARHSTILVSNLDLDEAKRLAEIIRSIPVRHYLTNFGLVATDQVEWYDLINQHGEKLDRTQLTDYQLAALAQNATPEKYTY